MSSILNTSTVVKLHIIITPGIKKSDVLDLLHDIEAMLAMNPLIKSQAKLPPSNAIAFYKTVPKELKPSNSAETGTLPVYSITEASGDSNPEAAGSTWRGGWAKRFIPDEISYETGIQCKGDGLVWITHAPMGVHSVNRWTVTEDGDTVMVDLEGDVSSNRMLMGFIKTTLQDSYDQLSKDFVAALEKRVQKRSEGLM